MINTLTKDSKENTANNYSRKEKEIGLKPIKARKAISNKELSETTASTFNLPPSITNIAKVENKTKEVKDEVGITGFNSQQNFNKYIQVYSCRSRAGNQVDGSRKTNQDSYLESTNILNIEDFCVFGVYDGHGMR